MNKTEKKNLLTAESLHRVRGLGLGVVGCSAVQFTSVQHCEFALSGLCDTACLLLDGELVATTKMLA